MVLPLFQLPKGWDYGNVPVCVVRTVAFPSLTVFLLDTVVKGVVPSAWPGVVRLPEDSEQGRGHSSHNCGRPSPQDLCLSAKQSRLLNAPDQSHM